MTGVQTCALPILEGFGLPKFIPQLRRINLEAQNHGTYAEVVQGFHGRTDNRKEPYQPRVTAKGKRSKQEEEEMGVNPRVSSAFGGESLVEKSGRKVTMGRARRGKGYLEMVVVDTRTSLPRVSLNSKDVGKRKKVMLGVMASQAVVLSWRLMGLEEGVYPGRAGKGESRRVEMNHGKLHGSVPLTQQSPSNGYQRVFFRKPASLDWALGQAQC